MNRNQTNAQALAEAQAKLEIVTRELETAMQALAVLRADVDGVSDVALLGHAEMIAHIKAHQHILYQDVRFFTRQCEKHPDNLVDVPF